MKIFLTGATGFIGSHFLKTALSSGHQVTAIRRPGSKTRIHLKLQPNWIDGDLNDNWEQALAESDILVHLAATGVNERDNHFDQCFKINVQQSLQLWLQAVRTGVKRFIICGSCSEYGSSGENYDYIPVHASLNPTTAYGASKAASSIAALSLAKTFSLQLLVVRPFHIYGPGESKNRFWPSLIQAARSGKDFPMTAGQQIRDFTPVTVAANNLVQLAINLDNKATDGQINNLGTGIPQKLLQFAQGEWDRCKAKGKLLPGEKKYRHGEVMRYVPQI